MNSHSEQRNEWVKILRDSKLTTKAKIVGMMIQSRVDMDRLECFPSISVLQLDTSLGRTAVINAIKELLEFGFITKRSTTKGSTNGHSYNIYKLAPPSTLRVLAWYSESTSLVSQEYHKITNNITNKITNNTKVCISCGKEEVSCECY